ncbi:MULTISPECIES: hypothetical protein [Candidatus Ichthyocystis]|uniref:hypothetical protein n=1 Tax=Candidatus Ichthyocystis TaxID=2929841 RepID=UPI00111274E3|nr:MULTISPECIES: hypothetical protein [Ichthyocystis]
MVYLVWFIWRCKYDYLACVVGHFSLVSFVVRHTIGCVWFVGHGGTVFVRWFMFDLLTTPFSLCVAFWCSWLFVPAPCALVDIE